MFTQISSLLQFMTCSYRSSACRLELIATSVRDLYNVVCIVSYRIVSYHCIEIVTQVTFYVRAV